MKKLCEVAHVIEADLLTGEDLLRTAVQNSATVAAG
jgi:hypothetical protein